MNPGTCAGLAGLACSLLIATGWGAEGAAPARASKNDAYRSERAVIVVTGMRINEDPADYRRDTSVGEGAVVRVTAADGTVREKRAEPFDARKGGAPHFTADFEIELGAAFAISMTFKDGTVVKVADYRIPRDWKTHFYFHATTGTLSPSSVLRFAEDPRTKLRCCVYAVYPPEAYRKLGGRQEP